MSTVEYNFETSGVSVSRRVAPMASGSQSPKPQSSGSQPHDSQAHDSLANDSQALGPQPPLHRISEVRQQQGTSLRSVARKLNLPAHEVRDQEAEDSDLRISELLKWQQVLEVPLADLLIDNQGPLSQPIHQRASMLRVMKTAKAILESSSDDSTERLAKMLVEQLVQIMPELKEVSAWHTVGQRRTQDEVGRIVERSVPDNFFNEGT